MPSKFTIIAAVSAFAFSTMPGLAQTATTTPAQPPQSQDTQPSPGVTSQDPQAMREMMQQMMGERAERRRERRAERQGSGRWEHGNHMERSGPHHGQMMQGKGGMRAAMHGTRMKIMFAIVDADGNGALALEEVQDFQRRIFNAVDQNDDSGVDMEEIQSFFHGSDDQEEAD